MNTVDEQSYRIDKIMKRGVGSGSRENLLSKAFAVEQVAVPVHDSPPSSSNEVKLTCPPRLRLWRGFEELTTRHFIISIVCLLSIFALSGSFMFTNSVRYSTKLFGGSYIDYRPQLSLSDQNSWPFKSAWERSGLVDDEDEGSGKANLGSSRSGLDNEQNTNAGVGAGREGYAGGGGGTAPPGCTERSAKLKLFMYDLPPEFHYSMLVEQAYTGGQIWPKNISDIPPYPGGLYQQHSPEYWLTNDLLTSNMAGRQSACTAFRVNDWRAADLMFVPFFASLAYNRYTKSEHKVGGELDLVGDKNQKLQEKLLKFLEQQPAWQASGGSDHIVVIHHPNSFHAMRNFFSKAIFIVADFGRYPSEVANLRKDVVAPYKHVIPSFVDDSTPFEEREILLFFQGTIVRKQVGFSILHTFISCLTPFPGLYIYTPLD